MIFKEVLFITRNRRGKINRNGPKFGEMVNSSNPTLVARHITISTIPIHQ